MKFTVLFLAILTVPLAYPQQSTCDITIPFNVSVEKNAGPVLLNDRSLEIEAAGQKISHFDLQKHELRRLFLMIDGSGSMRIHWQLVLSTFERVIQAQPPLTKIKVIVFGEAIRSVAADTQSIKSLFSEMEKNEMYAKGKTRLYDSLAQVVNIERPGPEDQVLLITDGADNTYEVNRKNVLRAAQKAGTRVSFVVIQNNSPSSIEEQRGPVLASEFAEQTGGSFALLWPPVKPDKEPIGEEFYRQLFEYYSVTFQRPTAKKDGLEMTLNQEGKHLKHTAIRSTRRLPDCH